MTSLLGNRAFARAAVLAAASLTTAPAWAQTPPALVDEIASRDATDGLAGGQVGAVSHDGRYVVFNNGSGIYRRDRVAGTTVRVDVDAAGQPAGSPGFYPPSMSPDGRFVTFDTFRTFPGIPDSNGDADIYLKDLQTNALERISIKTGGADIVGSNGVNCTESSVSGNGIRVAFVCEETGVTPTVFMRDRVANETFVVSLNLSAGISSGTQSQSPSISLDGRYVGFRSNASNLVAGDSNGSSDGFVRDLPTGTTFRISLTDNEGQIANANVLHVDIAANCYAAFSSNANNIVPGDGNGATDIFVRDWCTGRTEIASVDDDGLVASFGDSDKPWLSEDGRYVAFSSNASLVVASDFTSGSDVYVRDRVERTVARANLFSVEGSQFDGFAILPRLSGDGRQVIYSASGGSVSDQVVAVRNPVAQLLPVENVQVTAFGSGNARDSIAASISADGNKVVFVSSAQGFDRGWGGLDNDAVNDVFVYDYAQNCVEQASMSDLATNGDCDGVDNRPALQAKRGCAAPEICAATIEPSLEAGGNYVVFVTQDAAVMKYRNETDQQAADRRASKASGYAIALRNLITNATFRVGTGTAGGTGSVPRIAPGGGSVVFVSGSGLAVGDANGQPDVYRQRIKPDGSPDGAPDCVSCKDANDLPLPGGAGVGSPGTELEFAL